MQNNPNGNSERDNAKIAPQKGYVCPRCDGKLKRGGSTTAGYMGGLVGSLIASAFSSLHCNNCGQIPTHELSPETKRKYYMNSVFMVVGAIVVLVLVVILIMKNNK